MGGPSLFYSLTGLASLLQARYYSADPASRKPPPRQFLLGTALVLLALGTYSVA